MSDLRDLVYSISFQSNVKDLRLAEQSTEKLDDNIKKADASMNKMSKTAKTADGTYRDINGRLRDANGRFVSMGDNINNTNSVVKKLGVTIAGAFAVKKVVDFGKSSLNTFMDFEQSMANVRATMGNLSNSDFEALKKAAKEAGATTIFTAKESADALNYMALAGFNTKQSIEAMPNVLNLAAAGNMDLARASDLVTDGMSALGLTTKDLTGLIDQMAKTSQKSNTNVSQLGEAILTVGSVAKNAGLDTASMSAELGILANAGFKGSEGGTALRNVLLNLTAPTDEVAKLMKELGVRVVDNKGKIRPLNNILTDLRGKIKGVTEGEQQAIKATIGGKENVAALSVLLDGAGGQYEELRKQILNSNGAAKAMADTQKNTVSGAFKELQSALEEAQIAIFDTEGSGQKLQEIIRSITSDIPALKNGLIEIGGNVANAFTWILENKDLIISSFGGILGAILAYKSVMIIVEIYKAWKTATEATTLAQLALNNSLKINPIGLVVGLVAGLVAAFITAYKTSDTFREKVNNLFTAIKDGATTAINFAIGKINDLIISANSAIGLINKIPGMNVKSIDLISTLKTSKDIAKESARGKGGHIAIANEYARGTVNAAGGASLVGEHGPEVVNLNKGDTVTPTNTTRRILSGSNSLEFNPSINIAVNGGSDPQATANAVKEAVKQQMEEMFAMASVQLGYTNLQPS